MTSKRATKRRRSRRIDPPERVTLTIGAMAHDGSAVAEHDGAPVLVDYGLPGEEAVVELYGRRGGTLFGRVVEVLAPSGDRIEAPCPYFGRCGGCQWQHIDYGRQLEIKRDLVRQRLVETGGFGDPPVSPAVGMDEPWAYRNHARFSVGRRYGELGFTERRTYRFLPADRCLIMDEQINDTLAALQRRCVDMSQVAVRVGANTGERLVHPSDVTDVQPDVPAGQPYYHEELLGHRFRVSAGSFFQTNTRQAERLVELVRARLELSGDETVVDAYGGVGVFAVLLAPHARRVVSMEESAAAIEDARVNAQGIDNVELREVRVEDGLAELGGQVDALVLDPPRVGCHPEALDAVASLKPSRVVYVSCEPETLARDLRTLVDGGYHLQDVTPVDMFPHTFHIECVAMLVAG